MLKNKVAIITGAGTGIGKATARLFAKNRAKVIIHYCSSAKNANALRDELIKSGHEAEICQADISNYDECLKLLNFAVKTFNKIDILVNNSANGLSKNSILDISYNEFNTVIDTNLKGTYYMCTEALKIMQKQGKGGNIINISSSSVDNPRGGTGPYAASKAGIETLTKALAYDYGKENIRLNVVAPGATDTAMIQAFLTPERRKANIEANPMRKMAEPNDIANAVLYLASPMASHVTGERILVDGGQTIR